MRRYAFYVLSSRVFDLVTTIDEMSTLSIDERLKSYLLRRANSAGVIEATHEQIASHIATAREVISLKLNALQSSGQIRLSRGRIEVLQA